jgi:hypothetical protein
MDELRSVGTHTHILEMFGFYGLIDRFIKAENVFTKLYIFSKDKFIPSLHINHVRNEYSFMLGYGQNTTEIIFYERLAKLGIKVKCEWQYISHVAAKDKTYVDVQLTLRKPYKDVRFT